MPFRINITIRNIVDKSKATFKLIKLLPLHLHCSL